MRDLQIITSNDGIGLTANKDLATVTGATEYKQRVGARMRFVQGEWLLDTEFGLPLFAEIFRKRSGKGLALSLIRKELKDITGTKQILELTGTPEPERNFSIKFKLLYEDGNIITWNHQDVSG